jgi:hypothetical protein
MLLHFSTKSPLWHEKFAENLVDVRFLATHRSLLEVKIKGISHLQRDRLLS